jgi:ketosteroid isomerase-like protein
MVKELHSITVSEPLIATNSFACTMKMDVTMEDGKKMDMKELCVYEVKDGKIISEQFFV